MKYIYKNITKIALVFGLIAIAACDDKHDFNLLDQPIDATAAKMKFIHTAVGPLGTNFSVNYFINDKKISAVGVVSGLPLGIGYGGSYPASLNYALIPNGAQTIKFTIPARAAIAATPTLPAVPASAETQVFTGPVSTVAGKDYTTFLVGTSPNYSTHVVNDDFSFVTPSSTDAYIRFINLVTNTPTAGYELVITRQNPATPTLPASTTILKTYSAIGYRGGSPVFETLSTIPVTQTTPYLVQMRVTGTTTIVASLAAFVPRPGRTYTIFTRGIVGGLANGLPSATANIPVLTFYTNR